MVAYLSKWDIENIEVILAAKSLGKSLEQTEAAHSSSAGRARSPSRPT